jgi:hypothetical protein
MIRKSAILLLLIYLGTAVLPGSFRAELCKLPGLVGHFLEHRAEVSSFSFVDFLQLHYGEGYKAHQSAHNHSQLPGKGSGHEQHIACGCSFPGLPVVLHLPLCIPVNGRHALTPWEKSLRPSSVASGIWQPPRIG